MKLFYSVVLVIVISSIFIYAQKRNMNSFFVQDALPKYAPFDNTDNQGFKGVIRSIYKKNLDILENVKIDNIEDYKSNMARLNIDGIWTKYENMKNESNAIGNGGKCKFLSSYYLPVPLVIKQQGLYFASLLSADWNHVTVLIPNRGIFLYPCEMFLENITGDIFLIDNRPFLYKENE